MTVHTGDLETGDCFAGYQIDRMLGAGGMGAVYLAQDPRLPRKVALKVLHTGLVIDDSVRARFVAEADHVARLDHPNIVAVYDRGDEAGRPWIAMQYVAGTTAADIVGNGPVDARRALSIVTDIGRALDYAHSRGVLHRDVKPANILLTPPSAPDEPEWALLGDFGIAKTLDGTHLTRSGVFIASLQYAAPEQFDRADTDGRCDVYSLGCTLYTLLVGNPPYPGRTLPQLWQGHCRSPVPRPSRFRPHLPSALDSVIARVLAKDPSDRYPTCRSFVGATAEALEPGADQSGPAATVRASRAGAAPPLRVVLADDSALLRGGIVRLLTDEGIDVVHEAGDADELIRAVADLRPDIAVVDIRMPPTHTTEGIEAAKTIRTDYPGTAVLLLSQYVETEHVTSLVAAGTAGLGYLLKDRVSDIDEFVEALRRVAAGGCAIDPSVICRMAARPHRQPRAIDELSEREREVLALMAQGCSNRAIAAALFLGERTIEAHVRTIFLKLGLHPEDDAHRRVLAVLEYLGARPSLMDRPAQ